MPALPLRDGTVLHVDVDPRYGTVVRMPADDHLVDDPTIRQFVHRMLPSPRGLVALVHLDAETARLIVGLHGGAASPSNREAVMLLQALPRRVDPEELPTEAAPPPPVPEDVDVDVEAPRRRRWW